MRKRPFAGGLAAADFSTIFPGERASGRAGEGQGRMSARSGELSFAVYEDAVLVPGATRKVYRNIHAGAFTANGRPIEDSLLFRSWNPPQIAFAPALPQGPLSALPRIEGSVIYGGFFFGHFGHFLLESLARGWVVEEVGDLPFIWAVGGPPATWQRAVLERTGLSGPHRFPDRPVRVERLIVAQPGYVIQKFFAERHARFLCRGGPVVARRPDGERIWLSRSGVEAASRRSPGEARLERGLERLGWRIFHPESVSVAEQLETISRAAVLGGLQGSAFHAIVLLKGQIPPLIMLRRTPTRNFRTIAERKGTAQIDLYGAFATRRKNDFRLTAPGRWARIVDEAGREAAGKGGEALAAAEARWNEAYDLAFWARRMRRSPVSWLAHAAGAAKDAGHGIKMVGSRLKRADKADSRQ